MIICVFYYKKSKCTIVFTGKLGEYDDPMKLMKIERSLFGNLVKEYWSYFQFVESH